MKSFFKKMDKPVFIFSIMVCCILILGFFIVPKQMDFISNQLFNYLMHHLKWSFISLANVTLLILLIIAFSKCGKIRLGKDTDRPEYSNLSWFAMMFSAGMGVGLIFFGVSEPISHYMDPLFTAPLTGAAAQESMYLTFFHWGIHPWAIYASVALPFAYFHYRKGRTPLISSCIQSLFPNKNIRWLNISVDTLTVIVTLMGISISFGMGALQITSGIKYIFNVTNTFSIIICILIAGTCAFTLSSMVGIEKGMKRISDFNIKLAIGLIIFTFLLGPTTYIVNTFLEGIGSYLSNFIAQSFFMDAQQTIENAKGYNWMGNWTVFYWALWILWSPFVGIFIARISKGRTIREFIAIILLIPTLFSCIWFSVIGGSALNITKNGNYTIMEAVQSDSTAGIFALFQNLPIPLISSLLIMLSLMIFFITSADAATQVLVSMSCKGKDISLKSMRVVWSILIGCLACMFVFSGGIESMQKLSIIFTLPYILVIVMLLISLFISLHKTE